MVHAGARRGGPARAPPQPRSSPVVFRDTGHRTTERPSKGSLDVHTPTKQPLTDGGTAQRAVSYTHLTLPTICSV
eukprot:5159398-Prymnesium_polylepis.1